MLPQKSKLKAKLATMYCRSRLAIWPRSWSCLHKNLCKPRALTTSREKTSTVSAMVFQSSLLRCGPPGSPELPFRPNPTLFLFPGLESRPVWTQRDLERYPDVEGFVSALRENAPAIRKEYLALRQGGGSASDYAAGEHEKLHCGDWKWFSFIKGGEPGEREAELRRACPVTAGLLDADVVQRGIPFAYSFFSAMSTQRSEGGEGGTGGVHIRPHCSPCNLRLRVHLPLVVPPPSSTDAGLRVADRLLRWEQGEPIVFDDSYEHEAWMRPLEGDKASGGGRSGDDRDGNDDDDDDEEEEAERVVLLCDLWHPGLHQSELVVSLIPTFLPSFLHFFLSFFPSRSQFSASRPSPFLSSPLFSSPLLSSLLLSSPLRPPAETAAVQDMFQQARDKGWLK